MEKYIYRSVMVLAVVLVFGAGAYWVSTEQSLWQDRSSVLKQQDIAVLSSDQPGNSEASPTTPLVESAESTQKTNTNIDSVATVAKLDYSETKAIYDYRFQITNCSAITGLPSYGSLNVKQGANIVLENHDTVSHVLAIGTDRHTVAGADYVVIAAAKVSQPTGYLVTCDGKGAGRLYVYP